MLHEPEYLYFIIGTKNIIANFKEDSKSPLFADPYHFTVQKHALVENALKVVQRTIGHEAYTQISKQQYKHFYTYLNGALELITQARIQKYLNRGN